MTLSFSRRLLVVAAFFSAVFLLAPTVSNAQSIDKFYYWVGPTRLPYPSSDESFVIELNAIQAAEIEAIFATGGLPGFTGTIAAGAVDYNRNYSAPGQPVWNWHVAAVNGIFDFTKTLFIACMCPDLIAKPGEIAANPELWISQNGDRYTPTGFSIQRRIDPVSPAAMANVSNRGITGAGERALITGFIVTGGTPRNIVVRALGPSLRSFGVGQAAGNPSLEVYHGSTRIAANADWKNDGRANLLADKFPSLVPTDDKEAALWLTLLPGQYTIQAANEEGTEGIVLIEAYDADSVAP